MKGHNSLAKGAQSAVRVSIVVNLLLSVVKFSAGILGHSFALIADAMESWVDFTSSAMVWFGLRTASRPPDKDHPYGHGKAEPLSALFVAFVMLAVAVFIAFEAIDHIITPHELPQTWTLAVITGVLATKEMLYRFMLRKARHFKSTSLEVEAKHQRTDAVTSLAAFVGITIAAFAGPKWAAADDWAALFAAALIFHQGLKAGKTALSELMDKALPDEVINEVKSTAEAIAGVVSVNACFVRKMGFEWFVDIHLGVDGTQSVIEGHAIAHEVVDKIKEKFPQVYDVLTHIEPYEQ